MSLKIKFLDKNSIDKVLKFHNSAQSDTWHNFNRPAEEFEWLFINGFYNPAIYGYAIDDEDEEIIGTQAGIFIPMISDMGEKILTIKGEDTLIALDKMVRFGKRDIMRELINSIREKAKEYDVKFIWGFTPASGAFHRCGFNVVTQIKGSFYVINPVRFFKNRIKKFPQFTTIKKIQIFAFAWINFFSHFFSSLNSNNIMMRKIGIDEVDEELLLSFIPKNVISTYLNKDFLNWRIGNNPSTLTHEIFEYQDKKAKIISYIILSHNPEDIWNIDHLLFVESISDRIKIQILKMTFNHIKREKGIMIRTMGFSHNMTNKKEMQLLRKSGFHFFYNPDESYFVFLNLTDTEIAPENIYLSRLNTQGIR